MRASLSINARSLQLTADRINRRMAGLTGVGREVFHEMADEILAESALECPVETGTLLASQYKVEVSTDKGGVSLALGYGGPNDQINPKTGQAASSYMVQVHEDLEAVHPTGKAKFFEEPARRVMASFMQRFKSRAKGG